MNPKAAAAAALALLLLMAGKSQAKPLPETWRIALFLNPAIPHDDAGEAEDAIRNGISSAFAQANGLVRDYRVSDSWNVVTVLVVYQGPPKIAVGNTFSLPGSTTAMVLSAAKVVEVRASV